MSISYYNPVFLDDGSILSLDNVRVCFSVNPHFVSDFAQVFNAISRSDITLYPICTSDFKYKHLWKITYDVDVSMVCGYCFNGSNHSVDVYKGFLDFNPNKVGFSPQFWADFSLIRALCDSWIISRIDVAYDIKAKRENIILEKDNRKYALDAYSNSNKTEYLGLRSHVGYVKVYNKTVESKLDYDLTRIEITCEPNKKSFFEHYPRIWNIAGDLQLDLGINELNSSDLAILHMELELLRSGLDNGLMIFNSLARLKKQKLKKYLLPESCLVVLDDVVFSTFLLTVRKFI